jgi:hypothetical protein
MNGSMQPSNNSSNFWKSNKNLISELILQYVKSPILHKKLHSEQTKNVYGALTAKKWI